MADWLHRLYFGVNNGGNPERADLLTKLRHIKKSRTQRSFARTYTKSFRRLVRGRRLRFGNQNTLRARVLPTAELSPTPIWMLLRPLRQHRSFLCAQRLFTMASVTDSYKIYRASPIPGAETLADGSKAVDDQDWVQGLDLEAVTKMHEARNEKVKVLVLYGSLRERYVNTSSRIPWLTSLQVILKAHGLRGGPDPGSDRMRRQGV